jgi:hypothetical protein
MQHWFLHFCLFYRVIFSPPPPRILVLRPPLSKATLSIIQIFNKLENLVIIGKILTTCCEIRKLIGTKDSVKTIDRRMVQCLQ